MTLHHLKELFVLVSPNADFRNKFDSILAEIIENRCAMIELTKQRDELLPLLMNGQVTVNYHLSIRIKLLEILAYSYFFLNFAELRHSIPTADTQKNEFINLTY